MSKTKRTLIISSCIMVLAFVVTVVSVSAAWFGDMKSASHGGFVINSDTLKDSASIDINSSKGMEGESIYPAIAELGYFLKNGAVAPTGAVLKSDSLPTGVKKKAQVANVYFPIQFVGAPDSGYEIENRKSLHIQMTSANINVGENDDVSQLYDYKDEFNVDVSIVAVKLNDEGQFEEDLGDITSVDTFVDNKYTQLTGDDIFYECYGYDTYMLIQPGITYYIKAQIYFNKIDEECNFDLLNTVIRFNFKLNILDGGDFIRLRKYKTAQTEGV